MPLSEQLIELKYQERGPANAVIAGVVLDFSVTRLVRDGFIVEQVSDEFGRVGRQLHQQIRIVSLSSVSHRVGHWAEDVSPQVLHHFAHVADDDAALHGPL